MRRVLGVVLMLALVLAGLNACAAGGPVDKSLEVGCDYFTSQAAPLAVSKAETLAVGDTLTLSLCANPSTGFSWEEAKVGGAGVLAQAERRYQEPAVGAVGAAGREILTFMARKQGSANVSLDYSRPWQGGEKGVWKFTLQIDVK